MNLRARKSRRWVEISDGSYALLSRSDDLRDWSRSYSRQVKKRFLLLHHSAAALELRPRGFVRNESPRFEASTAIAPTVRPSSAAMRSTDIVPAMAFSLATSCSVHARLDSGTPTLPTKAPASWKMFLRYRARSLLVPSGWPIPHFKCADCQVRVAWMAHQPK